MTDTLPDWQRLHEQLLTRGFTEVGRSRGTIRLVWPDGRERYDCLWLPTDPTAPEYAEAMADTVAELRRIATWGRAADALLALVDGTEEKA